MKTHKSVTGEDCRHMGQTDYEYFHTALCGYVRKNVTVQNEKVDCKICLRELNK